MQRTSLDTYERQFFQRKQEIEVSDVQVMVIVQLGEDVRSVRLKINMEANEYLTPWRMINKGTFLSLSYARLIFIDQIPGYLSKDFRQYVSQAS